MAGVDSECMGQWQRGDACARSISRHHPRNARTGSSCDARRAAEYRGIC
jgi:hypothetical protein